MSYHIYSVLERGAYLRSALILKLEATKNFFFWFNSKYFFLYEILMQLTEVSFDCHNLFLKASLH